MREGRASGTVTVLFTDLVGSTDLMSRLGAETFDKVRQAHFAALRQTIGRHGGQEIKNTGDGLMATFGSVVDGIRGAVAMQQATDRQARSGSGPLTIRIGLSVGDVTFEDGDVFGAPVVEAARLVAAAGPGKILTTAIARALAGGRSDTEFVDLGPMELKGLPDPVPACEVSWQPAGPSVPMPALLTDIGGVFVGRDGEVERLRQLWKEAVAGERRVALIAGEPGVGKTRLAVEAAEAAHGEGAIVLAGRCDEDLGVPYQPFVEALRHFINHTPEDLEGRLGAYGGELVRLVPEISPRVPGLGQPLRSDPETERYRLFDAVAAWLAAACEQSPLLLVLDDLQWAAKPTLLLLRHVVRFPELKRLLILGTYRDTELGHDHPLVEVLADLRREAGVDRLSLLGLDSGGVAAFMEQAAGHELNDEDIGLAGAIYAETEGNPFFVREVLRHLTETGALQRREGRWSTRLPIDQLGIPEGVREVVGRRLARLSKGANAALRLAAVVGPEFELALLESTQGFEEEELVSALEEATDARLILEVSGPVTRYRFAHALVRDTLYHELSAARRVTLHRRVAEAIERVHGAGLDDYLPALAHHYGIASAPITEAGKAVMYGRRAGDRALAQLAYDEAATYYHQAIGLLDGGNEAQRLDLLIVLGEAQRRAGDSAHRATLLDAARLAQQLGDAPALAAAAIANTRGVYWSVSGAVDHDRVAALEAALQAVGELDRHTRARLLAILSAELTYTGDRQRCDAYSDEALQLARQLGDTATLASVLLSRHFTVSGPEQRERSCQEALELVEVAERLDDPVVLCWAYHVRARMAVEMADRDAAEDFLGRAAALAADLRQSILRWFDAMYRAGFAAAVTPGEEAERLCRETLQLGQASGQPEATGVLALNLLMLRLGDGDPTDAEEALRRAWTELPGLQNIQASLALLCCEVGREEEARELLSAAEAGGFARLPHNHLWLGAMLTWAATSAHLEDVTRAALLRDLIMPWSEQISTTGGVVLGSVSHYLGLLARTLGRFDEAEACFATALATHERLGAPRLLAWTRMEWARMLITRGGPGDLEQARELLPQALHSARAFTLGNVERKAVALLRELP